MITALGIDDEAPIRNAARIGMAIDAAAVHTGMDIIDLGTGERFDIGFRQCGLVIFQYIILICSFVIWVFIRIYDIFFFYTVIAGIVFHTHNIAVTDPVFLGNRFAAAVLITEFLNGILDAVPGLCCSYT